MSRRLICARTWRASDCFEPIDGSAAAGPPAARSAARAMTNAGASLRCERAPTSLDGSRRGHRGGRDGPGNAPQQRSRRLPTRNLSPTVLRCRPVSPRHRLLPVPVTVLVGVLLAVSLAGSGGADSAPALLQRAHDLRAANTALAARTHAALLQLYALDSRLARAHARLDALTAQADGVRRERVLTAKRLRIARHDAAAAAAAAIASTRAQQAGYLASLRAKERLNGVRISSLERAARAAQAKSVVLA